jgi:hypothetical protein
MMVHIKYIHGSDINEEKIVILKEYHFYISDYYCHDLSYVQHCFQLFYNHLKEKNIQMDQHWIWEYGCVGELKHAHVFQWLCMLHKKLKVPHIWNYFEHGHGKGEHYGVGTCIKRSLHRK